MATIVSTKAYANGDPRSTVVTWALITAANAVGDAFEYPRYSDRSVQLTGTFDSATIVLQGSNDGSNWETLHDPLGNAISLTAAGLKQVLEITRYVRPSGSGGGGSSSVTVRLMVVGKGVQS